MCCRVNIIVLFCLSFSYCRAQLPGRDTVSFPIAADYYASGEYRDAIFWFNKSIDKNYRVAESYSFMGAAKTWLGDFTGAKIDLLYSLQLNPQNVQTFFHLAKNYAALQQYDSAVYWGRRLTDKNTKDPFYIDLLASAYAGNKQLDTAIMLETTAIKINPLYIFYNNRGYFYQQKGDMKSGINDFRQCLQMDTMAQNKQRARLNIANCMMMDKQYDSALIYCNQVITEDDDNATAFMLRGEIYLNQQQKDKACKDFKTAEAIDADAVKLYSLKKEYLNRVCK